MAAVLRIENDDASRLFDLLARMEEGSWQTTETRDGKIIETINIVAGDQRAVLRNSTMELEGLLEDAIDYHRDILQHEPIWWRENAESEPDKRALIESYLLRPITRGHVNRLMKPSPVIGHQLSITRYSGFESPDSVFTQKGIAVSANGGTMDMTPGSVYEIAGGNLNSRIRAVRVYPNGLTWRRMWIGIRPKRDIHDSGTGTFDPKLEAEDMTVIDTADTSKVIVGGVSGTGYMKTTFTTDATRKFRFGGVIESTQTGAWTYVGRYLVLARYRTSDSSTEVGIRMAQSYNPTNPNLDEAIEFQSAVYPDPSTNWQLLELGELTYPPLGDLLGQFYLNNIGITIEAERLAGTGELHIDNFILLPNEHGCFWDEATFTITNEAIIQTKPNGRVYAVRANWTPYGTLTEAPSFSILGSWQYPFDGGILVLAAQRDGIHYYNDDTNLIHVEVVKRWRSYRT